MPITHLDLGYTDHPLVARDYHRRFVDIAIDAVLRSAERPPAEAFAWPAEGLLSIGDWWQAAPAGRRQDLFRAVDSGRFEVAALPVNMAPFLDARQWDLMLHWLPDDLWTRLAPRVAMQNDVNGLPRAAAMRLLDRNVRYLWMGLNEDSGGAPFTRPTAFWWKMPDQRRLLVWLGSAYWEGYDFFSRQRWRVPGQVRVDDTRFGPPRPGEILPADDDSVRTAHTVCRERLQKLIAEGYRLPVLPLSFSNNWRSDNDPPYTALADFVATWNRLGLRPSLALTTAGAAMAQLERASGDALPEYRGEWTDWWANGMAAMPRELAAARRATRTLAAAQSPLLGPVDAGTRQTVDSISRDLCLFAEHTANTNECVRNPFGAFTLGHEAEKAILAYRSLARAEWLLAQRARTRWNDEPAGLYVANPGPARYEGWVELSAKAFRGVKYLSVEDRATRTQTALQEGPAPRFWVDLPPRALRRFGLLTTGGGEELAAAAPTWESDALGWPVAMRWGAMPSPLFGGGLGDFLTVGVGARRPPHERSEVWSQAHEPTRVSETPHTIIFEQSLHHPRTAGLSRRLEVWKRTPRVQLLVKFNRLSSTLPERLFVRFPLPTGEVLPRLSNGGVPFTAFDEVLGKSCRDYFAIDGWAHYPTPAGHWLWVGHDSALVTFGVHNVLARRQTAPEHSGELLAILYDNLWHTNFPADRPGDMEFRFDLVWRESLDGPSEVADALLVQPLVLHNPEAREDPLVQRHLNRP